MTTPDITREISDAQSAAVAWAKDELEPIVAEDLDFMAKKKTMAQLGPKGARMLSGLLYAKYRQLLEAKCFRAGVELILIDPAYTSTIGAVKYAARRGWSVHAAAAGVIARRGQKLNERLPRTGIDVRVPVRGGHHALELPAGKAEIRVWPPGAAFMQRTEVRCTSAGSPPGAASRTGVRWASLVTVATPCPSAGTTVTPATQICMNRFVHH
ncbi:hypothetical protein [Paraburkholderia sp. C35]|uniref:hypothetical protein n=1 Tax=Paraburkholderia sp. C35 TaxID=2126993 RepID=UPI001EF559FB|nr:hypothetical protein [Paraburkholderia sp. C35]